ncbi:chorismate synthase [Candidatus Peregrinibacteria bacterium]|nr:chorismate synthase [Candidatus Peregrinibacteria bacterium]
MGNTFGKILQLTTWGESHGPAIGAILDGCPAGLEITEEEIQKELDKRKPESKNPASTPRKEEDLVQILSGIFEGKTTGAPISMIIWNEDQNSKDYSDLKNVYRPGHADLAYDLKYGHRDYRGGGRASGRETASRVMGGAIAKKLLKALGNTEIYAYTKSIGPHEISTRPNLLQEDINANSVRCPDTEIAKKMEAYILEKKEEGDSTGGIVEIIIKNPPVGLGAPCFDKLHADLAKAFLSIGTVRGFEIGTGFKAAEMTGSEHNDTYESLTENGVTTKHNHSGGIEGGISTGPDIILRVAVKPPSSIAKSQNTIDKNGISTKIQITGRHDACIIPRFIPVAEAMVSLTLADHLLRTRTSHL